MKDNKILLEIVQRLSRIEEKMSNIENNTGTMNKELGEARDAIKTCQYEINKLNDKFFIKLSWKQIAALIGGISALVTIVRFILSLFNVP